MDLFLRVKIKVNDASFALGVDLNSEQADLVLILGSLNSYRICSGFQQDIQSRPLFYQEANGFRYETCLRFYGTNSLDRVHYDHFIVYKYRKACGCVEYSIQETTELDK